MDKRIEIINDKKQKIIGCLEHQNYQWLFILCHGYNSSKDETAIHRTSILLNDHHLSTLRFDFTGSGESEGSNKFSLIQMVNDLKSVINYVNHYQKIILIGGSLGALPVCICASNSKVNGIVTLNGFFNGKIKHPGFQRTYNLLNIAKWIIPNIKQEFVYFEKMFRPELITKPMLIITTPNDEVLEYKQSVQFYQKLTCPKKLVNLPLDSHGLEGPDDAKMTVKEIIKWIKTAY
jgi:esterase/lipase